MRRPANDGRSALRGVTLLLWLGAALALFGAVLPWESLVGYGGGQPPVRTGLDVGWGTATAALGGGAAVATHRLGWFRSAPWVLVAGTTILAIVAVVGRGPVGSNTYGVGLSLTLVGGVVVAVAGAAGAAATRSVALPAPLATLPLRRQHLAGVAAAGGLLVTAHVVAHASISGTLVHYDLASWVGVGSLGLFALLGAHVWSRPVALVAAVVGAATLEAVVAGAAGTEPTAWPVDLSGDPAWVVALLVVGACCLVVAGTLGLFGAGLPGAGRRAPGSEGTETAS